MFATSLAQISFCLWVASSDYKVDIRISNDILKQLSESYRKIRNTARFILGNIYDFDPDKDSLAYNELEEIDKWALLRLNQLVERIEEVLFGIRIPYHAPCYSQLLCCRHEQLLPGCNQGQNVCFKAG